MLKVAIIGAGEIARGHAAALKQMRGVQLYSCCDLDHSRASTMSWEFGFDNFYTSVELMVQEEPIDAALVCVPTHAHFEVCRTLLTRPIHILCEKPMTNSWKLSQTLAKMAKKQQVVNMVGFEIRQFPEAIKAASLVRSGRLGRIQHVEAAYLQSWISQADREKLSEESLLWRLTEEYGGKGVLDDMGISLMDALHFILGKFREVQVMNRNFHKTGASKIQGLHLDSCDSAIITAEFAKGGIGALHLSRWAVGEENTLRIYIYGERGSLKLESNDQGCSLRTCTGENRLKAEWTEVYSKPVSGICQNFITAIRKGENTAQPNFSHAARLQEKIAEKDEL